ncbi:hypothetical protein [Haloactinomyces albus]|uniref:Uncharacterized protein n=1 Tax=Haloactinomyces albus TaxID=1352928 RepID=A0AAE3ZFV2_9ACTN|nr:hypothetical protein [Haloactinomyces albus]MDR7303210.1 hypothetical protein [Haloactinomyces albus]
MDLLIFLAGIAVLTGLGMLLAWPRHDDLDPGEHRREPARQSARRGKA